MDYSSVPLPSSEVSQRYINASTAADACVATQPKISLRSSTEVKDLPLYQWTSTFSVRNTGCDSFPWIEGH
jgi:hypothetical protein